MHRVVYEKCVIPSEARDLDHGELHATWAQIPRVARDGNRARDGGWLGMTGYGRTTPLAAAGATGVQLLQGPGPARFKNDVASDARLSRISAHPRYPCAVLSVGSA